MVISIIIIISGLVSLGVLPVTEYPDVAPPQVSVEANYPGANAYVVEDTVTRVLEDKINGVKNMIYMSSSSTSSGRATINVFFEPGYDLDIAAVDVQNRVSEATPMLPPEVRAQGVTIYKQSPGLVCLIAVKGDERYSEEFLSNFVNIQILDELKRIKGVGKAENLGEKKYSMRIWLDPDKVKALGLTPNDIKHAVESQNKQASLGRIGAPPTFEDQRLDITLTTKGRLSDVEEFENIVLKYKKDGSLIRLKDVATVPSGTPVVLKNS